MKFGILGSGSWGTALAKILTDNGNNIYWWNRSAEAIEIFKQRHINPQYLSSAKFKMDHLQLTTEPQEVIQHADIIVVAIPSAFTAGALQKLPPRIFENKK